MCESFQERVYQPHKAHSLIVGLIETEPENGRVLVREIIILENGKQAFTRNEFFIKPPDGSDDSPLDWDTAVRLAKKPTLIVCGRFFADACKSGVRHVVDIQVWSGVGKEEAFIFERE